MFGIENEIVIFFSSGKTLFEKERVQIKMLKMPGHRRYLVSSPGGSITQDTLPGAVSSLLYYIQQERGTNGL